MRGGGAYPKNLAKQQKKINKQKFSNPEILQIWWVYEQNIGYNIVTKKKSTSNSRDILIVLEQNFIVEKRKKIVWNNRVKY